MENLIDNWEDGKELLEVRRQRRSNIIKGLILVGCAFLLVFGVLAVIDNRPVFGYLLLGSMGLGLYSYYLVCFKNKLEQSVLLLNALLITLALALIYSGGKENSGILWVYPIFAINLLINRFKIAMLVSGSFIILCAIVLLTPLAEHLLVSYTPVVAVRFIITLLALYGIGLVAVYSEEHAYSLLVKLHDNDIHRLAFYDALTGLPNRWNFNQNLARLIARRKPDELIALLFIDLDNFKSVNDNYGHEVGDKLLLDFGHKLRDSVRPYDVVTNDVITANLKEDIARLAGDEFVVILTELRNPKFVEQVVNRIAKLFEGGYELDGTVYPVYVSIGISFCPNDTDNAIDLVRFADAAMYKSKSSGNNCHAFFTQEIAQEIDLYKTVEVSIKQALDSDQFYLVYQPIFCSQTQAIVGMEALIRCHNEQLAELGPDVYIPIAESTGLIKRIDHWVIEHAIKDFIEIREATQFDGKLSINISGVELLDQHFPSKARRMVSKYKLPANLIALEVTETAFVPNNTTVLTVLTELSQFGFSISLDDFGTGYTAFNQLLVYPASSLKLDRSFVNGLFSSDESIKKMVQTIHNLAKIYQLNVIAEGVETQEQFDYLKKIGCDWVQGYLLSRPIDKDTLIGFIQQEQQQDKMGKVQLVH